MPTLSTLCCCDSPVVATLFDACDTVIHLQNCNNIPFIQLRTAISTVFTTSSPCAAAKWRSASDPLFRRISVVYNVSQLTS